MPPSERHLPPRGLFQSFTESDDHFFERADLLFDKTARRCRVIQFESCMEQALAGSLSPGRPASEFYRA